MAKVEYLVNREDPLREIASSICKFMELAAKDWTDVTRDLPTLFSAGMFGWGKTALASQAVLQFNMREKQLLSHDQVNDPDVVKSTWLCYVDFFLLNISNDSCFTKSTL